MNFLESFGQLIGQDRAIEFLQEALKSHRLAPAYLFIGATGIGRSLAAQGFAVSLLTLDQPLEKHQIIKQQIIERNYAYLLNVEPTYQHQGRFLTSTEATTAGVKKRALPQIRLEAIKEITQFLDCHSVKTPRSVVIIEDAECMTEGAANALLKTLEEPKVGVFILIAKSLESVLPTLVSRCQYIPFKRLSESQVKNILQLKGFGEILQYPDLISLGQGSPGETIEAYTQYQALSIDLRVKLNTLPTTYLDALKLAKTIDQELDLETQLWLIGYLQQKEWQNSHQVTTVAALEGVRRYLLAYVQPRLVWEDLFLKTLLLA